MWSTVWRCRRASRRTRRVLCPECSEPCARMTVRRAIPGIIGWSGLRRFWSPPVRAGPVSSLVLGKIVGSLPNTAPGLDGISSRIVKHVWKAVQQEFCEVINRCVKDGVFPGVWKSGRLLVIPKGNGRPVSDPKAYRPITLLPVLGKILEKILLELAPGLRGGISGNQHGFVPGRSTSTALNDILGVSRGSAAKYVQLIFLDISGAFDNAWWPMVLTKVKRGGFPPNLYRLLTDYFTDRRVGFLVGAEVVWKRSTMGCPQGSVLGPALWNVLLDDLLRLPFPAGVKTVAYADDVTVLVEASSRAEIERRSAQALDLMQDWGRRNRLAFAPAKSCTMTVKGRLQRPPIVRMGGDSIRTVSAATVLGLVLDEHLSLRNMQTTYLTTLTYVAGAGERANARSTQCPAEDTEASLGVTDQGLQDREHGGPTGSCRVLPAHMEVMAGKVDRERGSDRG
ncbi:Putative 115 kDa protein in type-1 retrotransposable element R1DM [Eumeta japonica]|uniref:115 kDa protein in type-1 retrotransposable element R1DM n=1 Tax=Eumeta variegata TaxID=151549 RepID=A0A4C1WS35_EUMVA|nr:Putative 115 kDa protein in type-1 retrotransposable element R1DM [Eumeta japonica]